MQEVTLRSIGSEGNQRAFPDIRFCIRRWVGFDWCPILAPIAFKGVLRLAARLPLF